MLEEIIAGMTNSVELAALETAKENRITTGGFYSGNTDDPPCIRALKYKLRPLGNHHRYGPRLLMPHIRVSDAALIFLDDVNSPDFIDIRQKLEAANKKTIPINIRENNTQILENVIQWLVHHRIQVLHIVGTTSPSPEEYHPYVRTFIQELLQRLREDGQLATPRIGTSIWRNRWSSCNINRSIDSFTEFLENPTENNLAQLKDTTLSVMMGQFVQADRIPDASMMSPLRERIEVILDAHDYVCKRLDSFKHGEITGERELLEGFLSYDEDQDFERYLCAITILYLWKASQNIAYRRRYFSELLRHAFAPHLERYLNKSQNGGGAEDKIHCEDAIAIFLKENSQYLDDLVDKSFDDLRKLFQNRCKKRLQNVRNRRRENHDLWEDQENQETIILYGFEALSITRELGNRPRDTTINAMRDLVEESRRAAWLLSRELCQFASSTINHFNQSGRQIFLAMLLGGLSHKQRCAFRSQSQLTKHLVQSDFISYLQNQNRNFVQQWFRTPLREIVRNNSQDIELAISNAMNAYILLADVNGELIQPNIADIDIGWNIFVNLSNYIAEEIQEGRCRSFNLGFNRNNWLAKLNDFLEAVDGNAEADQNHGIERTYWFTSLTKFACDAQVWRQENLDW